MATYKTPGIYIEELSLLPASIVPTETAIPAFIGYTQKAQTHSPGDLNGVPKKIRSLPEYEQYFGLPFPETGIQVFLDVSIPGNTKAVASIRNTSPYCMHYGLQLYFANGGGPCYIISAGTYATNPIISALDLKKGLDAIKALTEITLIVFPDAIHLPDSSSYYALYKNAMLQCVEQKDRFTIMDVWIADDQAVNNVQALRDFDFGTGEILKYGAAYYPPVYTTIYYAYEEVKVSIIASGDASLTGTLAQLKQSNINCYELVKKVINEMPLLLPVAPAVAGLYAMIDNTIGVWKAPANVNISLAKKPLVTITTIEQEGLNIDSIGGKSINAIRSFTGRGAAIIWGARTLAGNDNDWRYISVRRFFMLVEGSVSRAMEQFVFEPNAPATWVRVKALIENFLILLWKQGALQGSTPKEAYFVNIGIGETMTLLDLQEGRLTIEIGMAVIRPAEFIIVQLIQKMTEQT